MSIPKWYLKTNKKGLTTYQIKKQEEKILMTERNIKQKKHTPYETKEGEIENVKMIFQKRTPIVLRMYFV